MKELENLSLSANASLAESANASRAVPAVNAGAVESAKGADDTSSPKETNTSSKDGEDELDFLTEMMTTQFHHSHHRAAFHQVCCFLIIYQISHVIIQFLFQSEFIFHLPF